MKFSENPEVNVNSIHLSGELQEFASISKKLAAHMEGPIQQARHLTDLAALRTAYKDGI